MMSEKLTKAKRLVATGNTSERWGEMMKLVHIPKTLDLSKGFPDSPPPEFVRNALMEVAGSENWIFHQYTRPEGHLRLVRILAKFYSPAFTVQLDSLKNILVTQGAFEAVFCILQSFINPGDEVIIIEPHFRNYVPGVRNAGGTPVLIPLRPTGSLENSSHWTLDNEELASKFNKRTKAVILTNPHNPSGKVFTREELQVLADLAEKWDVLVIADEVYEGLVFSGQTHIKMASLPGMWERTLTLGSAGKILFATGWRVGWVLGPAPLLDAVKQTFGVSIVIGSTPIQEAVAIALEEEFQQQASGQSRLRALATEMEAKRDLMATMVARAGFKPVVPHGGCFIVCDISGVADQTNNGYEFVKWMIHTKKISAFPCSLFLSQENEDWEKMVRFCFIKGDESINKMQAIMENWEADG